MTDEIVRNRRQRKKLYLDEYTILGFDFSFTINMEQEADYDEFFDAFTDLIDSRNLFVSVDGHDGKLEGFVTSGDRYGSATEEDRKAIEEALSAQSTISDVVTGRLLDAFYEGE